MIKTESGGERKGKGVPDLSQGITATEHAEIVNSRNRPLTDAPIGNVPSNSNESKFLDRRASIDQVPVSRSDERKRGK